MATMHTQRYGLLSPFLERQEFIERRANAHISLRAG